MTHSRGIKTVFFISVFLLVAGAILPVLFVTIKSIVSVTDASALAQILVPGSHQWQLFKNTFIIFVGASIGAIMLGVPLALAFSRTHFPGRSLFLFLCPVPLLIPSYVHTIGWTQLLYTCGWMPSLTEAWLPYINITYGHTLSIWILILSYYPVVTLFSLVAFNQIDSNLEQAARMYANKFRVLKDITCKLALPGILSGGLFVLIFTLSDFSVPSMMGINVLSLDVFYQFSSLHRMDQAAISVMPLFIISFIALFCIHRLDRRSRPVITTASSMSSYPISAKTAWLIAGSVLLMYVISIILPISTLVDMTGPWENYTAAIANARQEILVSFWTSAGAATLAMVFSVILGYTAWSAYPETGNWLEMIAITSFAFPAVGIGIGIIGLWNQDGIPGMVYASSFILVIAYFSRYISFAFKPVWIAMNYVDRSMDEHATIIGIPWWQRIRHILVPLTGKGLMVSWYLVYLFSLTDLSMSILVHPPGKGTVPVRIYNMLHFGRQEWVGALCIVIIGLAVWPYIIFILWSVTPRHETDM